MTTSFHIPPSGQNRSGVFRDVVQLLKDEVAKAGGPVSVLAINTDNQNGARIWSSPLDSDSMRSLQQQ